MAVATVTSKGQITIPKNIRDFLKLDSGDRLDFVILPDGQVVLKPITIHVTELKGILNRKGMKPVSVERMNEAIKERFKKTR